MNWRYVHIIICVLVLGCGRAWAVDNRDTRPYLLEIGAQAGVGYLVCEPMPHIFMRPSWVAGGQFRYKPTPRWAVAGHANIQDMRIPATEYNEAKNHHIGTADITAEFNFFRFGSTRTYDSRVKAVTPYMFLGVGFGIQRSIAPNSDQIGWLGLVYMPFGIGLKARLSQHIGLNLRWQHDLCFADNLEAVPAFNNAYGLNGSNPFNNDLLGQLELGFVVEFARQKKVCRFCQ